MTKQGKTSFDNMMVTTFNSTILFMCMWTYDVMVNTNSFEEGIFIYYFHHPSQFVLILFYKRIVVQPELEIYETY